MQSTGYLIQPPRATMRPMFAVVDAHNHLWGDWNVKAVVRTMNAAGVACYCDLTANARVRWADGGYVLTPGRLEEFFQQCVRRYQRRFYGFTMATFAGPANRPLFSDARLFARQTVELFRQHVAMGARGLKITKELGLHFRDAGGKLVNLDDARLAPIFDAAAAMGVPVLMHQSDPVGFFEPVTPENEHYESLKKYPSWSFADPKFPRKRELMRRRDRVVRRHPQTTFILPHVANYPENLQYVSRLLDENPNVYIDFSARMDELGRQPHAARKFFIRHQDRILFGTDMPAGQAASVEMYSCYYRFLETFDDCFYPPDYDGTFDRHRWAICGLGLPKAVLAKIYYKNALKIIPGLRGDYQKAAAGLAARERKGAS